MPAIAATATFAALLPGSLGWLKWGNQVSHIMMHHASLHSIGLRARRVFAAEVDVQPHIGVSVFASIGANAECRSIGPFAEGDVIFKGGKARMHESAAMHGRAHFIQFVPAGFRHALFIKAQHGLRGYFAIKDDVDALLAVYQGAKHLASFG